MLLQSLQMRIPFQTSHDKCYSFQVADPRAMQNDRQRSLLSPHQGWFATIWVRCHDRLERRESVSRNRFHASNLAYDVILYSILKHSSKVYFTPSLNCLWDISIDVGDFLPSVGTCAQTIRCLQDSVLERLRGKCT